MGLFSGGGFLGDVGGALGINTSAQQKALERATGAQGAAADESRGLLEGATDEARRFIEPLAGLVPQMLPQVQQGATVGGFGQNISDILSSGMLDPLIADRQQASQSALASSGLSRSNVAAERAAEIPTELAFGIEQLLSGRQGDLLSQGASGATNLANLLRGSSQDVSNIITGQGAAQSQNLIGQQQLKTQGLQNIASLLGGGLGAAGEADLLGSGGMAAFLGALSDMRLKTNLNPIGTIGDLTVYEWDWIQPVKDIDKDGLMTGMNAGFLSQDVEKLYPDMVGDFAGYKTIDYGRLLERLVVH